MHPDTALTDERPDSPVAPSELTVLVRGSRQARWLEALLSPEGLHHSDGRRGRYSPAIHRDISRFVYRCRCAGWRVSVGRLSRGTDRYFLDPADRDAERGQAYATLGDGPPDELVSELAADAQLRRRTAGLMAAREAYGWWELTASDCVDLAWQLTAQQAEVLAALMADSIATIHELAATAVALAPNE